jgi:ATP-binding cassette subfamily F protein 3
VGGYSTWIVARDAERQRLEAAAVTQARQIAQTEAFIERFRARATKARQVQSRVKALQKIERIEVPGTKGPRLRLALPEPPRSGRDVVVLDGVHKAYGATTVFRGLDLVIERGRTIAVLGPNGAGKSTLLRLVAGVEDVDGGTCRLGHNVTAAYFAQHHTDALDLDRTVLAELDTALHDRATNPRSVLGAFGFPGDTVDKLVGQCSGGERARLALAKLVVGPANLLCLDEPTNHLDLASRELLTAALAAFEGTVLLVTHDRALIGDVADGICAVGSGTAELLAPDLEAYLAGRPDDGRGASAPAHDPQASGSGGNDRRQQRRDAAEQRRQTQGLRNALARAEAELEGAEQRLAELERMLADPTTYEDPEVGRELAIEHAVVSDRVAAAGRRWEDLVAQVDDVR